MRKVALFSFLALFLLPALAEVLTCNALRDRVDAKLQAKGVRAYTLEIVATKSSGNSSAAASSVAPTDTNKGKEVGTCEGGTKRLIYTRDY